MPSPPTTTITPTITTGVTGAPWRASITSWGGIVPWEGRPLDWYVAADDRWHVPAHEPAVRQRRIEGTPVTETRVRVPHGDVVQRVFSVADAGGLTVIEVENESTLPVAVAFDRRDVLTERPIADVPIHGIELPPGAFVLPLGHAASLRIAIPHGRVTGPRLPDRLPTAARVVRGWTTVVERAGRYLLPDGDRGASLVHEVVALRCELALGDVPHAADDPVGACLAIAELVRMGERPDPWLPELVEAVGAVGPVAGWECDVALAAADRVLVVADETRARRDLARICDRRTPSSRPAEPPPGLRSIAWLEGFLATGAQLLPDGLPAPWLGQSLEVYGVPTGPASTVAYALRWHGSRPAVLWEQAGTAVGLTAPVLAPDWRSDAATGEALWPAPAVASDETPGIGVGGDDEPTSFT